MRHLHPTIRPPAAATSLSTTNQHGIIIILNSTGSVLSSASAGTLFIAVAHQTHQILTPSMKQCVVLV